MTTRVLTQEDYFDMIMSAAREYGSGIIPYMVMQFEDCFDVNYTVYDKNIGMNYIEHTNDICETVQLEDGSTAEVVAPNRNYVDLLSENDMVLFSGRLIHYAILKNDLETVEWLLNHGSELYKSGDYENYAQAYANSIEMINLISGINSKRR